MIDTTAELERLKRLAKPKVGRYGARILPRLALRTKATTPTEYVRAYYAKKIRAPFQAPLAEEYDFEIAERWQIRVPTEDHYELTSAIQDAMQDISLYLSNYLTHPRYLGENQIGFVRGDTLRPIDIRHEKKGTFSFRVRGVLMARRGLPGYVKGPNKGGQPFPKVPPPPAGGLWIFFEMPTRPDARGVDRTEWYDFNPAKWKRKHPTIKLRPPIPVLLRPRVRDHSLVPHYDRMYRDGIVKTTFLAGYDAEGHNANANAKRIWEALVARPSKDFSIKDTGQYGYHGRGLGFDDPTNGHFDAITDDTVFRRGAKHGVGPLHVRYRASEPFRVSAKLAKRGVRANGRTLAHGDMVPAGALVEHAIEAEVRIVNFDRHSNDDAQRLNERFTSVFKDSHLVTYDGHANYGGGFYVGDSEDELLWADDIGDYAKNFSRRYQIFSIGACHAAGYFADLFYNELSPTKSPRNLDIVAAVNETSFADSVQTNIEMLQYVLQLKGPRKGDPPVYDRWLRDLSYPAEFQAFIGVFADARRALVTVSSDPADHGPSNGK